MGTNHSPKKFIYLFLASPLMEKPEFILGAESKFAEFIANLNDKDIVALISHTDLDGLTAAKITNQVIDANIIKFVNYPDINLDLIKELKKKKVTKIIMTDLSIESQEFITEAEKFAHILIIDHHPPLKDFNSDRTTFMNAKDFCAGYLCYYLFSKIENLEKWDWLAAAASISDWAYFQNKEFMTETLKKHGDSFVVKDNSIRKSGKFWELQWGFVLALINTQGELNQTFEYITEKLEVHPELKKHTEELQKEIDKSIEEFKTEKEEFSSGYFWLPKHKSKVGSIISTLISSENYHKSILIIKEDDDTCGVSARRQDKKIDMGKLLKELTIGFDNASAGGHIPAAGATFPKKYLEEFLKRIRALR